MTFDQLLEAQRLHELGFKLCELHPLSKQPVGDGWNNKPVTAILDAAGGYGLMLALNGYCSIDFDDELLSEFGLSNVGMPSVEEIRHLGVGTVSTRPGSGGRVTFRVPAGETLSWIKFSSKSFGTVLELRASSPNLQDTLPGTVYHSADGSGPWTQAYANGRTMENAPPLPPVLLDWWRRLTEDIDYRQQQQLLFIGSDAQMSISAANGKLAFESPHRVEFNRTHQVVDILSRHKYKQARNGRWAPHTASGAAAVREIPGRDDLWQSDHASDPLHGTFDAWTAHVVLDHDYDLASAERPRNEARAAAATDGFEDEEIEPFADTPTPAEPTSVPALADESARPLALSPDYSGFVVDTKTGKTKAILNNVLLAIGRDAVCGFRLALDTFRDEIMIAPAGSEEWRAFNDVDYTMLRSKLESPHEGIGGFEPVSKDNIKDAVHAVAHKNKFDSAQKWLNSLPDDGQDLCETFLSDLFGAEDTPYHRAASLYLWTALAGRVLVPGIKADMALILVGPQGHGKSTAISALVPSSEYFVEISFSESDENLARKMRGKLVGEIAELRGLLTKDAEGIKAFITRTDEEWVQKWKEFSSKYPRRLIFIGTTNLDEFLADPTGERRWVPVKVGVIDVEGIKRTHSRYWAEGRRRFLDGGIQWQKVQELAKAEHAEFATSDPWDEPIAAWLIRPDLDGAVPTSKGFVTNHEVLIDGLRLEVKNAKRSEQMRVAAIMKRLGFQKQKRRFDGVPTWTFVPR